MTLSMSLVRLLTLACLLGFSSSNNFPSFAQDASKKKTDQVKLESNQVELIDVSEVASQCTDQKGTTLRVKVTSASAIDVRVYAQNMRGRWYTAEFKAKKQGDEVSTYTCFPNGKFKVQTRPVSDKPWQ